MPQALLMLVLAECPLVNQTAYKAEAEGWSSDSAWFVVRATEVRGDLKSPRELAWRATWMIVINGAKNADRREFMVRAEGNSPAATECGRLNVVAGTPGAEEFARWVEAHPLTRVPGPKASDGTVASLTASCITDECRVTVTQKKGQFLFDSKASRADHPTFNLEVRGQRHTLWSPYEPQRGRAEFFWSPDSTQVAIVASRSEAKGEVYPYFGVVAAAKPR